MKKLLLLFGTTCFSLIITGCASNTLIGTVSPKGDVQMDLNYDFSSLQSLAEEGDQEAETAIENLENFCFDLEEVLVKDFDVRTEFSIESFNCEQMAPLVFESHMLLSPDERVFIQDDMSYFFNAGKLIQYFNPTMLLSEEDSEALFTESTLQLSFPENITQSDIGEIGENVLLIDLTNESLDFNSADYWVELDKSNAVKEADPLFEDVVEERVVRKSFLEEKKPINVWGDWRNKGNCLVGRNAKDFFRTSAYFRENENRKNYRERHRENFLKAGCNNTQASFRSFFYQAAK